MVKLIELQKRQKTHDEQYHRDIYFLSHQERFKHMAFHFGKYSGKIAKAIKNMDLGKPITSEIDPKKTLIDSFIVILNCAEIFSLNLEQSLNKKLGIDFNGIDLNDLVKKLNTEDDHFSSLKSSNDHNLLKNLLMEYSLTAQTVHKACDSLDHMEGIDREKITDSLLDLLVIVMLAGTVLRVNFEIAVPERWNQIEKGRVL